MSVPRLRLAPVEETMFPPRAPFFHQDRLGPRGAQVAAQVAEKPRGSRPVPPKTPSTAHRPEIGL
jgi:hypothetical protein